MSPAARQRFAAVVVTKYITAYALCAKSFHSQHRGARYVAARFAIAQELRAVKFTYKQIGAVLGRNHSTIEYYLHAFTRQRKQDQYFRRRTNAKS